MPSTSLQDRLRATAQQRARGILAKVVDGADDAKLERRFGSPLAQRVLFSGMARSFRPDAAGGFEGRIVYELSRPATGAPLTQWTVEVSGRSASARPGGAEDASLTLRFQLADFIRVAAGITDPTVTMLSGRGSVHGNFALAARLPEMFGPPPVR